MSAIKRDQEEFRSQLPSFDAKPSGPDRLEVKCPRSGCRGVFWVKAAAWRYRVGVISAACPYCFKAAKVPGATNKKPKKIVKRRRS